MSRLLFRTAAWLPGCLAGCQRLDTQWVLQVYTYRCTPTAGYSVGPTVAWLPGCLAAWLDTQW
eukprot:6480238-Heterocapsa_arctica.AAC.1